MAFESRFLADQHAAVRALQDAREIPLDLQQNLDRFHVIGCRFLEALGIASDEPIAFRTLIDDKGEQRAYEKKHGYYGGRNHYGSFDDLAFELLCRNIGFSDGQIHEPPRGVFFMANETDGEGFGAANVVGIRSVFVDDDQNQLDFESLVEACPPSAIVQSKNGAHVYWAVDDLELHEFEPHQKAIARHLRTDASVHDLSRIMRFPGCCHVKDARHPFMVDLVNADPVVYSHADVSAGVGFEIDATELELSQARKHTISTDESVQPTEAMLADVTRIPRFRKALEKVPGSRPGGHDGAETNRHGQAYKAAAQAHDYGLSQAEALPFLLEWNEGRNDPPLEQPEIAYQLKCAYRYCRGEFGGRLSFYSAASNAAADNFLSALGQTYFDAITPDPAVVAPDLDCERLEVPAGAYISDHVVTTDANTIYILDCPHGQGKTTFAKSLLQEADTALVINPTNALSVAAAEALGIPCYTDGLVVEQKIVTTFNSLPNLKDPRGGYAAVMVDEIDQCLDYLHSGKVPNALTANNKLWACVANARVGILASADLTIEYIEQVINAIRQIDPNKRIVWVHQPPEPGRRTLDIVSVATSKAVLHRELLKQERGGEPFVIFCTGKEWPQKIASQFRAERPDLRIKAISGENSRLAEVQDQLRHPNALVEENDILILSPAVKSGVSIMAPVRKVHVHHTCRDVPSETLCQMPMRCRIVRDSTIVYGIVNFDVRDFSTDDAYLLDMVVRNSNIDDRRILSHLPDFSTDYRNGNQPLDALFTAQWCVSERRRRKSYNNPLQRLCDVARGHGWVVQFDRLQRGPTGLEMNVAKTFNVIHQRVSDKYNKEQAQRIVDAGDIDPNELRQLQRQTRLSSAELDQLRRGEIKTYFERDITVELALKDRRGEHRFCCRRFNRARLHSQYATGDLHSGTLLAFIDYESNLGKQKTEYRHSATEAHIIAELFQAVSGHSVIGTSFELAAVEIRRRAWAFYVEHHVLIRHHFQSLLHSEEKATKWFNAMMKRVGAEIDSHKRVDERYYTYSFAEVIADGAPELERIKKRYQAKREVLDLRQRTEEFLNAIHRAQRTAALSRSRSQQAREASNTGWSMDLQRVADRDMGLDPGGLQPQVGV